jgi:hypothetical protein
MGEWSLFIEAATATGSDVTFQGADEPHLRNGGSGLVTSSESWLRSEMGERAGRGILRKRCG